MMLALRSEMCHQNEFEPGEQSLCIVCWLRPLIADNSERENVVQFLLFCDFHKQIYRHTPEWKLCKCATAGCPSVRTG